MKKAILVVALLAYWGMGLAVATAQDARGVLRWDLVGKSWHQLPSTKYPGFALPLPWKTNRKYELRHFQSDFEKRIVTIVELPSSGQGNDALILSALDFSTLREGEIPEQDCFYTYKRPCDGRLCEGLLIGVVDQRMKSKNGSYVPREVWRATTSSLRFENVSPKNVVCRPQSYAE